MPEFFQRPKIVVAGPQGVGASSVIQSIVGLDFMPIGVGRVTTRRPLEINLNHQPEADKAPWAMFPEELGGKKFTDFNEVRDAIIDLTDKVCGPGNNIVDKPIILFIY